MGRRPKVSRSYLIKDLTKPIGNEFYTITREGVTYQMPMGLMDEMKRYFKRHQHRPKDCTVANWYKDLPKEDRVKVIRTGHKEDNHFYPDTTYED